MSKTLVGIVGLGLGLCLQVGAVPKPDLWGLPFGITWVEAQTNLESKSLVIDVEFTGDQVKRQASERIMMLKNRPVWGKVASTIQLIFQQDRLTKVRVSFQRGQNNQTYFDSWFTDLQYTLKEQYFPPQQVLSNLKQGAAWHWPDGEALYLGYVTDFDLVLIMEERDTAAKDEPGLFPKPSSGSTGGG